jgi:predicted Zn-dependent protease
MRLPVGALHHAQAVLAALSLVVLPACSTNPVTGRSQFMIVSEETAITQSSQAYSSLMGQMQRQGRLNDDRALNARVKAITERVVQQAVRYRPETRRWNWQMQVVEGPDVNAFCMAGGKMAIYTGLIEKVRPSDDELAQVIAHEIAHALSNHTAEKLSVAQASQLGAAVLGAVAQSRGLPIGATETQLLATVGVQLPNSRTAETEADRIGIELAAKAGYDPYAAVSLWRKMTTVTGSRGGMEFLSTHPAAESRITELQALVPQMMPLYRAAKGGAAPAARGRR